MRCFKNIFTVSLCCGALLGFFAPHAQAQTPTMFPFVIPWDDATKNAVDVSYLNPAPLTEQHRIVSRNGHFFDQTGRRVKFLGANMAFGANFPTKADAEKIAARMHKYGFNMVRLHHMDGRKAPDGLWDPNFPDMQHLDAAQLDKLDYFVSQLKKHGIYVDLNLHVSRKFNTADGFPEAEKLPHNGKVTAWYEPRMVQLQKQFAREMLTRRNPYTGLTYAQDPAVALIEIHNEDSMLDAARDGRINGLPELYRKPLVNGWNQFLRQKYGSTAAMLTAWNGPGGIAPAGLIADSRFASQNLRWKLERTAPAEGNISIVDTPREGSATVPAGRALKLSTTAVTGTHWHLQTHYGGLPLQNGKHYTLKFWARSQAPRNMTVYTKMEREPWQDVGLRQYLLLTPQWKQYELHFTAKDPLPNNNRLTFVMGEAVGDVWITDVQLTSGFELSGGQSLETGNIELVPLSGSAWGQDYAQYLMNIERDYADGMRDYIKKDLSARGLVTCSQSSYGGLGGVWRESKMDFVDMHAYWQHPSFPRRSWDMKDWNIRNMAMVSEANYGTLPGLAMNRVAGKPFTVSEYNHPAPNSFSAETLPLVMSYAAWQNWDGVMLFDYNAGSNKWNIDKIMNFFSVDSHPAKMAFLPASAALLLRGTTPQATQVKTLQVPTSQVLPLTAAHGDTRWVWREAGVTAQEALNTELATEFVPDGTLRISEQNRPGDGNALKWTPANGQFQYEAPHAQFAVSRTDKPIKVELKDWKYEITGSQLGFASLALFSRDQKPVRQSASLLLTVVGNVENQGMVWNADRTSVSDQWGSGPVLAEGLAGNMTLKTVLTNGVVYALDSSGKRAQQVPARWSNGEVQFAIGPQYKTLWYEIASK